MIVTDATKAHAQGIVDYIIEHPEQHNQATWWGYDFETLNQYEANNIGNVCGTTMCIAGTSIYLTQGVEGMREKISNGRWVESAKTNLGLSASEASRLFYCMDNSVAFDAVNAIANGDVEKFDSLLDAYRESGSV